MKPKVYPIEVFDKDGNLTHIEFLNETTHDFEFQSVWDPRDAQTQELREEFRKWSSKMAKSLGYDICI
jgi:hypothetical protein